MRRLTSAAYRRMPWRNGGGTTTEIVVAPLANDDGSAAGRFLFRVSIADVASDGPFSRFEGYDRHIMLLEGAGMTLDCGPHGRIALARPLEPHAFSGDWDVHGALVAGAVRDFNLIVDRATASATLDVRMIEAAVTIPGVAGDTCVFYVVEGALAFTAAGGTSEVASTGDAIVADATIALVPRSAATRVAISRVSLR